MICERCGKEFEGKYGKWVTGRFCSRNCANARIHSEETKNKISKSVKSGYSIGKRVASKVASKQNKASVWVNDKKTKICRICQVSFEVDRKTHQRRLCQNCYKTERAKTGSINGRRNAQNRPLRSKNEIYFFELCQTKFQNLEHNTAIFNGWDADIIIHDIKVAVLWNGEWHYRQNPRLKHSLLQTQNRDVYKLKQIVSCGYTPVSIVDFGRHNKKYVEKMFEEFIKTWT